MMKKSLLLFVFILTAQCAFAQELQRNYRHYQEVPAEFYNASMMEWGGDNLVDRLAMVSPEAARKRAEQLKELGINLVIYNGRHFRLSYQNEWPAIAQEARIVTEACHAAGIRVIEHHDFTIPAYSGYPFLLQHFATTFRLAATRHPHRRTVALGLS